MDKIYVGTDGGELYLFPVKAESNLEEEDEHEDAGDKEEEDKEEEDKEIEVEVQPITTSHNKLLIHHR